MRTRVSVVIDTERVRRCIRAALVSLPLLACEPSALPQPGTTRDPVAPSTVESEATMLPITEAELPAPLVQPAAPVLAPEDPARRAREIQHAENRKMPRPVSGRPLCVDGQPVVSPLRRVEPRVSGAPLGVGLISGTRAHIAAAWMTDARNEHASVVSFERARAELLAWGAPTSVLEAMRRAAADERSHTRLCLEMAWRYGAPPLAPAPLAMPAPRGGTLASLSGDLFEEGCVNETFAATVAATGAGYAGLTDVRALLHRISDDESRHAALAWATMRWAVARDPSAAAAVAARAEMLRPEPRSRSSWRPGPLARHGRLDGDDLARVYAFTWRALVEPLLEQMLAARA